LVIDKEYLSIEDVKYNDDSLFIISNEETNKTGAMVEFAKDLQNTKVCYKPLKKTKMIIMACNIATLTGFQGRLLEANINFTWYGDITDENKYDIPNGNFTFASVSLP
jgi:hypothetical protein